MKIFPVFFRLEYKRACKMLPGFLAGAIVLMILLSAIAFLAGKVIYGDKPAEKISVGVVLPKEDKAAEKVIEIVSAMDSVKSVCEFEYINTPSGSEQLLMFIPDNFVQNIINGTNTPVTIVYPEHAGVEMMLFREMADAGAKILSSSQAAIYATDDFCVLHGIEEKIPLAEDELNRMFIRYALSRENMLRDYSVSATGDISVTAYFAIYMLVLCLMLLGIPASSVLKPFTPVMERKLNLNGISSYKIIITRICIVASMLLLASAVGIVAVYITFKKLTIPHLPEALAAYILLCLSVASILVCIYKLAQNHMAAVMTVFILSVFMVFISGGFIPAVFLPDYIRKLSVFMPSTYMAGILKSILTGVGYLKNTVILLLITLFFFLISLLRKGKL